jgi:hypothetical protein
MRNTEHFVPGISQASIKTFLDRYQDNPPITNYYRAAIGGISGRNKKKAKEMLVSIPTLKCGEFKD